MKKSVVCVLLAWMVLLGGCSTQPLEVKGISGISCIISEGTNLGEEIYIESNQPLIHAQVESLVGLEGAEIFTPAFSNESFSEFEHKEKGYRYVLRFIVNQAPNEKNWYHFTEAKITAESEKEKKTITVSLDHSYEVKESDAFTDWMHERSVFYGWNHLDFSDVLPQGAQVLDISTLDARAQLELDTALPLTIDEGHEGVTINKIVIEEPYQYYSGGFVITYRLSEDGESYTGYLPENWWPLTDSGGGI